MNKNLLVISGFTPSLILFREDLIKAWLNLGYRIIACAPQNHPETIQKLNQLGVHFIQVKMRAAGVNPLGDLRYLFELNKILKIYQPQFVFAYTIKAVIYGMLACRIQKITDCYALITGLGYTFENTSLKARIIGAFGINLYRLALKKIKVLFFQNPDDRELFIEKRIIYPQRKSVIIPGSGVNLDYFKYESPHTESLTFLLIGRLIGDKGILEFIEAARIFKRMYPSVEFQLLGYFYPSPNSLSSQQVEKWHNEGTITYFGETQDVRPFLKNCSVYVLPSYREGTPRSVLEAMAMGRPIITTDAPGCRETVIDGENGFLVKPRDVDSLVQAMEKFIQNPGLIPKMGKRSREIAEEKYDVHKVNKIILEAMGLQNSKDAVSE